MKIEYQVTFTRGTRVGTRSSRTMVVEAATRDEAIRKARSTFSVEFPGERSGYRVTSTFSDEDGYEPE